MVIKLQSILSPDFNHGVMVLECFLKMRPKRNRRHMAGSRHTNFWSDQTRPTTAPSDCSCKTGYYWRSMSRRRRRTHHSVEFFVWPHLPQSCYKAWEGATLQTQKWVQKWVALHQEDISRFLADYIDYLLCTAWNTTNFRHYHQCACCTRTDCSTHGLT